MECEFQPCTFRFMRWLSVARGGGVKWSKQRERVSEWGDGKEGEERVVTLRVLLIFSREVILLLSFSTVVRFFSFCCSLSFSVSKKLLYSDEWVKMSKPLLSLADVCYREERERERWIDREVLREGRAGERKRLVFISIQARSLYSSVTMFFRKMYQMCFTLNLFQLPTSTRTVNFWTLNQKRTVIIHCSCE